MPWREVRMVGPVVRERFDTCLAITLADGKSVNLDGALLDQELDDVVELVNQWYATNRPLDRPEEDPWDRFVADRP